MRTQYFLFNLILLSVFGLISCSSDKSPATTPSPAPVAPMKEIQGEPEMDAEIQNADQTIQRLKDLKYLRASALLKIIFEGDEIKSESRVVSLAECRTNFDTGIINNETILESVQEVAIKDILPSAVFKPTLTDDRSVLCDFNVTVSLKDNPYLIVKLENVEIDETATFINFPTQDFLSSGIDIYFVESLKGLYLTSLSESIDVETLCSFGSVSNYFNASRVPLEKLFPARLFQAENLERCRLLVRDINTKKVWLSKRFFVQNQKSNLTFSSKTHLQGTPNTNFSKSTAIEYFVTNTGSVPSYIMASIPKAQVAIRSVYRSSADVKPWYSRPLNAYYVWRMSSHNVVRDSSDPNKKVLRLDPGETLSINMVFTLLARCKDIWNPNNQNVNPICANHRHLGQLYEVSDAPTIYESRFDDFNLNSWNRIDLNIAGSAKRDSTQLLWAENPLSAKDCPQFKLHNPNWSNFVKPGSPFWQTYFCQ